MEIDAKVSDKILIGFLMYDKIRKYTNEMKSRTRGIHITRFRRSTFSLIYNRMFGHIPIHGSL